jgi:GNAT superfamily N-acetyltransferase
MVTYQREHVAAVWDELMPLGAARWAETKEPGVFSPNRSVYENLEAAGALVLYTVREEGVLIGAAAFAIDRLTEMDGAVTAQQIVLFVAAEHRQKGAGAKLLGFAEAMLREVEVVRRVRQSCRVADGPFLELLEDSGYVIRGFTLEKELG